MSFLYHWGLFSAEALTLVIAILAIIAGFLALVSNQKSSPKSGRLTVESLNAQFEHTRLITQASLLDKKAFKQFKKSVAKKNKSNIGQPHLFVIDFNGDIKASAVEGLKECINAILLTAKPNDEVALRLESPGGAVHCYGLAASQLQRLRDANLKLTVLVDRVAASGGYLMASLADTIIAAPFAIIGSIGVVFQLPNFNRVLNKHQIEFEQITAGEYKRTLSMFGKNTADGRDKVQSNINETQLLFKDHVKKHRPSLDIDAVATGEHWYGQQALTLGLIDAMGTSDQFLMDNQEQFKLYHLRYHEKKKLGKKIADGFARITSKWIAHNQYGNA